MSYDERQYYITMRDHKDAIISWSALMFVFGLVAGAVGITFLPF